MMSVDMIDTKKCIKNIDIVSAIVARARLLNCGSACLGIAVVRSQTGSFPRYDIVWGADVVFAAREVGNPGVWSLVLQRESNEHAVITALESVSLFSTYNERNSTEGPNKRKGGGEGPGRGIPQDDPVAFAYFVAKLVDELGSQQAAAGRLGISRSGVQNALRLLKLPAYILSAVSDGRIVQGAARALSYIKDESKLERLATALMTDSLSVRQLEDIVAERLVLDDLAYRDIEIRRLENLLSRRIGGTVTIGIRGGQSGVMTLSVHESAVSEIINKLMDSGYQSPDIRVTRTQPSNIVKTQIAFQNYDSLSSLLVAMGYRADDVGDE